MAPKAPTNTEPGTFTAYPMLPRPKGSDRGSYDEGALAEWAAKRRWIVDEVESHGQTPNGRWTQLKVRCHRDPEAPAEDIAPRLGSDAIAGRFRIARKSGGRTLYLTNLAKDRASAAWSLDTPDAILLDRDQADEVHRALAFQGAIREVR